MTRFCCISFFALALGLVLGLVYCGAGCSPKTRTSDNHSLAFDHVMNAYRFRHAGQIDKAIHEYQKAVRLDPSVINNHVSLAKLYEQTHNLPDAIAEYRMVLALEDSRKPPLDNPAVRAIPHYWIGEALYKNGQMQEAKSELKAAVKIGASDKRHSPLVHQVVVEAKQLLSGSK